MSLGGMTEIDIFWRNAEAVFASGTTCCCATIADMAQARFGIDPLQRFRGAFSTPLGAARTARKAGYAGIAEAIIGELERHGWAQDAGPARNGDVAMMNTGKEAAPFWFHDGHWLCRLHSGALIVPAADVPDGIAKWRFADGL